MLWARWCLGIPGVPHRGAAGCGSESAGGFTRGHRCRKPSRGDPANCPRAGESRSCNRVLLHSLGLFLPFFNPFCHWQSGRNEPGKQASLLLPASIPGVRVPTDICSRTYSLTAPYPCALFPTASDGTVMVISYPWEGRSALNSSSPGTWGLGTAQI